MVMEIRNVRFHLAGPPPPPAVHLREDSALFVWAGVVFFGSISQNLRNFRVAVEDPNTFKYITVIELVFLPCNLDFLSNKLRKSVWEFLVDDVVKLFRI